MNKWHCWFGPIEQQNLQGFLLSGRSNQRNEVLYEQFYLVVEKLKRGHHCLRVASHTAITDAAGAKVIASHGNDKMIEMFKITIQGAQHHLPIRASHISQCGIETFRIPDVGEATTGTVSHVDG